MSDPALRPQFTPVSPAPAPRLAALRAEVAARGIDGLLVPLADAHQGEYIPACAKRLAWLTGFTGSAGLAIVLADRAALFVDGRYTLQAADQVDTAAFEVVPTADTAPDAWLRGVLTHGMVVGFDPWLHTPQALRRLERAAAARGARLVPTTPNPVDAVWTDRPAPPRVPIVPHPLTFAGEGSDGKRARIGAAIVDAGARACVLTAPDSIAWLLNIRGGDVPHAPLPLAFATILGDGHVTLFCDPRKVTADLPGHLGPGVTLRPPEAFDAALDDLGAHAATVLVDPATAARHVVDRLVAAGAAILEADDPCQLPKARKNPTELDGIRAAHRRDGVALCRFLAWLDAAAAAGEPLTELGVADHLARLRAEGDLFQDLSFPTISGAGPNGAIVHYAVTPQSSRPLHPGDLYLVDSGGQYLDGTTDVTRTVLVAGVGPAPDEAARRFTRVLQGHIALATIRFPAGTSGGQLDALARAPLWADGVDYDHGTGHGVGAYLSVHEGPQRIAKAGSAVPLQPGMVVSNEPGYYKAGAYGIRIENLQAVVAATKAGETERPLLAFETLTLAPIDRRLIVPGLLSAAERAWVDGYHARVLATIGPLVDDDTRAWLRMATAPLAA